MDRNDCCCYPCNTCYRVALRKESVDRNLITELSLNRQCSSLSARRAWIEMSSALGLSWCIRSSLSARRAWIEINELEGMFFPSVLSLSARRAWIEIANFCRNRFCPTSLSARRAWIEIRNGERRPNNREVALRKESVDRNFDG